MAQKQRKISNQEIVLRVVGAAGLISLALVAPGAVGVLAQMGLLPRRRQYEYFQTARDRMIRKGLLSYTNGKVRLTSVGETQLRRLQILNYRLKSPKRWDKKWRLLSFDIPEKRKGTRDMIRKTLARLGFVRLQDSVWVYPYDCESLITLLKADFRVGKDMCYMVVERIEYDRPLKQHFCLA